MQAKVAPRFTRPTPVTGYSSTEGWHVNCCPLGEPPRHGLFTESNSANLPLNHWEDLMSLPEPRMNLPVAILFALILAMVLPIISFAQGRGNGRGAGKPDKCSKFVNCHDARDGRVDGRGPAVQNNNPYPNNYPYPNNNPYPNNYPYPPQTRNRGIDRDGDGDIDRDDRILNRRDRNRGVDRDGDGDVDRDDYRRRRQGSRDGTENRDRRVRRQNRITDTN